MRGFWSLQRLLTGHLGKLQRILQQMLYSRKVLVLRKALRVTHGHRLETVVAPISVHSTEKVTQ